MSGPAQLLLSGNITVSPPTVTGTTVSASPLGTIPAGVVQQPLALTPSPKPSAKQSKGYKNNSSALGSFVTLSGVGATDNVTTADTVVMKSDGPVQVQFTLQNLAAGGVGTTTAVMTLYGTGVWEFPAQGYCTGIALAGNANVEYTISGPA